MRGEALPRARLRPSATPCCDCTLCRRRPQPIGERFTPSPRRTTASRARRSRRTRRRRRASLSPPRKLSAPSARVATRAAAPCCVKRRSTRRSRRSMYSATCSLDVSTGRAPSSPPKPLLSASAPPDAPAAPRRRQRDRVEASTDLLGAQYRPRRAARAGDGAAEARRPVARGPHRVREPEGGASRRRPRRRRQRRERQRRVRCERHARAREVLVVQRHLERERRDGEARRRHAAQRARPRALALKRRRHHERTRWAGCTRRLGRAGAGDAAKGADGRRATAELGAAHVDDGAAGGDGADDGARPPPAPARQNTRKAARRR